MEYITLKKIAPAVSFKCVVGDKTLTASIVEELEDPLTYTFRVIFSDGVNITVTSNETLGWITDYKKHRDYVTAIYNELEDFLSVYHHDYEQLELKRERKVLIVWIGKDETGEYTVHFSGKYQFHIRKVKGIWQYNSVRVDDKRIIDETIVKFITDKIDAETKSFNHLLN